MSICKFVGFLNAIFFVLYVLNALLCVTYIPNVTIKTLWNIGQNRLNVRYNSSSFLRTM